jgi:hypothetical protein
MSILGHFHFDHTNQMIALAVITFSGFHCIKTITYVVNQKNVFVFNFRIPAGADNPPCLKISHVTYEQEEKADWEFLRLSLPVACNERFIR